MAIEIRSKKAGFRRCGVAHPAEWIVHEDGVFTPEQIETLKAEPTLQVREIEPTLPDLEIESDPVDEPDVAKPSKKEK
jgi:hypothetical protein